MRTIVSIAVLALAGFAVQEVPRAETKLEPHAWLRQLVGEWTVTAEAWMAPGAEPMLMESTENVRAIGELWVVAEGKASFGGEPFSSVLTLGYDARKEAFVGTWIDSLQSHLWIYRGSLDEGGKKLTLEAEGPAFDDPEKSALYRDAIEIVGPDRKRLTSSVKGADGSWTTFLRAEYTRKK